MTKGMMTKTDWTHIPARGGMGAEEQWLLRSNIATVCALKRRLDDWEASMLQLDGISAATLWLSGQFTLLEAKGYCETEMRRMGWRL